MFHDLSERRPGLEEMDKPNIAPEALESALRSLARINTIANAAGIFWPPLRKLLREHSGPDPLRVLDVGCGAGDLSRRLEGRARRQGYALQVDGCDFSPVAIAMARRENRAAGGHGAFYVLDAVHDELPGPYDVVLSSLFLHHLHDHEGEAVLRRMADRAGQLLLVSDLLRSRLGLLLVYVATYGLSRSPVVHQDGVTSLRAAYTVAEVEALFRRTGLDGAHIVRRWPERFLAEWRPPER